VPANLRERGETSLDFDLVERLIYDEPSKAGNWRSALLDGDAMRGAQKERRHRADACEIKQ